MAIVEVLIPGLPGPAGPAGVAGPPGLGSAWRQGSGVPGNGIGVDGDYYLRTSNGDVYGPKTAGAWGAVIFNIAEGRDGPSGPAGAAGAPGDDGREVELQTSATHVQWRYAGTVTWTDLVALSTLTGPAGAQGPAGPAGTAGANGQNIELQASATHVQWRLVGAATWTNLVALSTLTGAQGPAGPAGATGPAGPTGATGAAGADGADGKTVLNGSGAPSSGTGTAGDFYLDTAASRLYGPKVGSTWGSGVSLIGPQGATGATGATGAAGTDGRTILNGSGAPAAGLGANGDFYLDTTASRLYGPKAAGAWGSGVSLIGPQGATGATGSQGPAGAAGQGVPAGGSAGQQLRKKTGSDYDTEWFTATATGSGTKTLQRFTARDNQPPAANFATLNTRNSISVLEFDSATQASATFIGVIPEGATLTSGLVVRIWWMGATATSGNVRWAASFERSGTDLDADSFDTATEVTSAANGTSGIETVAEITCTAIDSLAAGERFRLRIARKAADATNDTMTGDAQIVAVEVRGVA